MFRNSHDYHELNAGTHRNSPKNISAPALTWHIAFWTRSKSSGERGDPDKIVKLRRKIDDFFASIYRSEKPGDSYAQIFPVMSNVKKEPFSDQKVILLFETVLDSESFRQLDENDLPDRHKDIFRSRFRSIAVRFKWNGLNISLRSEVHTEYFTITTTAELPDEVLNAFLAAKTPEDVVYSTDPNINKMFVDMKNYILDRDKYQHLVPELREFFFRSFWRSLEDHLKSLPHLSAHPDFYKFSNVFADFRGIILSEKVRRFRDPNYQFEESKLLHWGQEAKDIILPILKVQKNYRARNYECTINYMLGGRALYMSALAPQLPEAPMDERIPVEFIIYAHQHLEDGAIVVNKRQLGRLVNHIQICGTLRLAALRDVKMLHLAGSWLSKLDEVMQEARDSVAASQATAMDKIKEAHEELNKITRVFLHETQSGLAYRIERSRYYVSQFNKNVEFLRIRRLEGNQPYDQFVEKRLGAEFDFINRLGIRFERATHNMAALDQNYLAMNSARIAERTNAAQDRIGEIAVKSIETAHRIEAIQEWGEFALVGVLVPYYVTHLLELFVVSKYMPFVAVAVWGVLFSIASKRISKRAGYLKWAGPLAVVAILGGMTLGWALFGWSYKDAFKFVDAEHSSGSEAACVGQCAPAPSPVASPAGSIADPKKN